MQAWAAAAFAAGLLGGVHCVGMCGGIVGALSAGSSGPAWRRLAAFNVGRILSYAVAGALAGTVGVALQAAGPEAVLRTALFVFAQAMVILIGCYVAGWSGRWCVSGARARHLAPRRPCESPLTIVATRGALGAGAVGDGFPEAGLRDAPGGLPRRPPRARSVLAAFGAGTYRDS